MRHLGIQNILSDICFVDAAYIIRVAANESAIMAEQLACAKGTYRPKRLGASPIVVWRDPLNIHQATIPLERIKLLSIARDVNSSRYLAISDPLELLWM
jgi:hypothetical protein